MNGHMLHYIHNLTNSYLINGKWGIKCFRDGFDLLRSMSAYPGELLYRMNEGKSPEPGVFGENDLNDILKELDDQAMHSLRTMIPGEYARCKKLPGDVVVKAYSGLNFMEAAPDTATEKALQKIRKMKK